MDCPAVCDWCGREVPADVMRRFTMQVGRASSGDLLEAGEPTRPPNTCLLRIGGGVWGPAKLSCPAHRLEPR